jgi:hypothetical protein
MKNRIIPMLACVAAWVCFAAACHTLVRLWLVEAGIPLEADFRSQAVEFQWLIGLFVILVCFTGWGAFYCTKKYLTGNHKDENEKTAPS